VSYRWNDTSRLPGYASRPRRRGATSRVASPQTVWQMCSRRKMAKQPVDVFFPGVPEVTCFDGSELRLPQDYAKGRRPETSAFLRSIAISGKGLRRGGKSLMRGHGATRDSGRTPLVWPYGRDSRQNSLESRCLARSGLMAVASAQSLATPCMAGRLRTDDSESERRWFESRHPRLKKGEFVGIAAFPVDGRGGVFCITAA
jgi:hypothetical protein